MEGSRDKEVVSLKRSRSSYMEEDNLTEEMLKKVNEEFQFPRLLSSRRLLDLEVN